MSPISCPGKRRFPSVIHGIGAIGLIAGLFGLATATNRSVHDPRKVEPVVFSSPAAELAGTLILPERHGKVPCVVIVGGSLSHTRDGGLARKEAPPRDALRRLAEALADAGYASLRYDKPGHGGSKTGKDWKGTSEDEARVAAAGIGFARKHREINSVIVAGESAGAYLACLAAKEGAKADAYLFLGGLCGSSESMYEYTFGGLAKYADSKPERGAWAENARHELAVGRLYKDMLQAAAAGKDDFTLIDGPYQGKVGGLARRREELRWPPDEMFKHIQAPALALAGAKDLNVPPDHAVRAVGIMQKANNPNARYKIIPGCDHSFQVAPVDEDLRFQERYTFASFRRPYEPKVYQEIVAWLHKTMPVADNAVVPENGPPAKPRTVAKPEIDAKTDTTPERLQLAPGIEIINDITDKKKTAAVDTLEGRIGPLLLGEKGQCHFLDMPAGMFVAEHPHSRESIIYTVRGQWVLCSQGRRHVMKPGTLFRFGSNISTGYEVPFAEDAYILVFKSERTTKVEKEFIDYLQGFAERLKKEQKEGVPYLLKDLPGDHPARLFAREVNPRWEAALSKERQP